MTQPVAQEQDSPAVSGIDLRCHVRKSRRGEPCAEPRRLGLARTMASNSQPAWISRYRSRFLADPASVWRVPEVQRHFRLCVSMLHAPSTPILTLEWFPTQGQRLH